MNYKAIGKNVIIEFEPLKESSSVGGLNFGSGEFDDQIKAKIISVGSKVTEPIVVVGARVLMFKNKMNKLSPTIGVTTELEIICGIGEE